MRPRTQYAKCGDLYIAYQVFGDGPVDLLYAQGWLTNVEYAWESPDYARFLTKLGRFARVIFFDKRGTGMSDRNVGVPTLEERSQDINAVMEAVGSQKVALFGMSEGGAICSYFAATYPQNVSHLILYGSRPRYAWAPDYPAGTTEEEIEASISDLIANWGGAFELDTGAPSVAGDRAAAEWFAAYFRYSASPGAAEQITRMNYMIDYRDLLPAIRTPTLVLHREGDLWCPVECADYLADNISAAQKVILPGDDHLAWYGNQDDILQAVEEFVTGDQSRTVSQRKLLTVVFIDIVGSTDKLSALGDERWKSLVEQMDIMVSRRVGGFAGRRVKHTGDGYMLCFEGPTSAIECAREIRRDLDRLGLQCRTGIHTGECEQIGEDLSGLAVNIAARIMDTSGPQEITVSQTVKDLVVGSDTKFGSAGDKELKGVPGRWSLHRVAS
ncbi:adenylate/guanylate cyclase domain-containing protein [Marimonas sp. MJW-29]|uniref:Adenylate/guanylate cyclase domain-containing protein n=1 Tax=Sulfitobacter sediminis TaxID=3234186 RepID=A0ABV3RU40_9RHOB